MIIQSSHAPPDLISLVLAVLSPNIALVLVDMDWVSSRKNIGGGGGGGEQKFLEGVIKKLFLECCATCPL